MLMDSVFGGGNASNTDYWVMGYLYVKEGSKVTTSGTSSDWCYWTYGLN